MAIRKAKKIGIVEFIHYKDESINTDINEETGEPYSDVKAYQEEWDFEKHCVLREGITPTKFKVNFNINYDRAKAIKNSTIGGQGKDVGFKLGNYSYEVVQNVLVGIEEPEDLELADRIVFKMEHNKVSKSTMEELEALGIIEDIFSFYQHFKENPDQLKKK